MHDGQQYVRQALSARAVCPVLLWPMPEHPPRNPPHTLVRTGGVQSIIAYFWNQHSSSHMLCNTATACLRDLQRFLRRDDPDMRDAFFKVGELGVAQNHLVPLLVTYPHEAELAYNTCERGWQTKGRLAYLCFVQQEQRWNTLHLGGLSEMCCCFWCWQTGRRGSHSLAIACCSEGAHAANHANRCLLSRAHAAGELGCH